MDILHDQSQRTWYQISTKLASHIPDFVLDSEYPTKEAADKLTEREFADEGKRMFPINSPAATWFSAAYFTKHASNYEPGLRTFVESRIKFAADVYGIRNDVDTIIKDVAEGMIEKRASHADNDFGWTEKRGNKIIRKYPMFDAAGVKKANDYFAEYRFNYPPDMRKTIATAIWHKSAQYGVKPNDAVRVESGHGLPRRDTLMDEVLYRANITKDAECSTVLANLNQLIASVDAEELGDITPKLAEVLDTLDDVEGFNQQYNKTLMSPADILYSMDMKLAEDAIADSVELDRHIFSIKKLANLDPDVFGAALGTDFADRIKTTSGKTDINKLADELYSLPRPDKAALEDHLWQMFKD